MNLAFFLAVTHLIEAWLASHSLQIVHCVCSRTKSCVFSKCVDVQFERLLVISLNLDIGRFHWIWLWVQKEEESISFASFGRFPRIFCNIKSVAKLALENGWLKLVTKSHVLKLHHLKSQQVVVPLVRAEGNQRGWRKVSVVVWF